MAYQDYKIEIFEDINDTPIAPTASHGGNGSHLISNYNSLIDTIDTDVNDIYDFIDDIYDKVGNKTSIVNPIEISGAVPTFKNKCYMAKAFDLPAQSTVAIKYPQNTIFAQNRMMATLYLDNQRRMGLFDMILAFSRPNRIIGNDPFYCFEYGQYNSANINYELWGSTWMSSYPQPFFLDQSNRLHISNVNSGDGLLVGQHLTNTYSANMLIYVEVTAVQI